MNFYVNALIITLSVCFVSLNAYAEEEPDFLFTPAMYSKLELNKFQKLMVNAATSYGYPKMKNDANGMTIEPKFIYVNPLVGNRNIDSWNKLSSKEKFQFINSAVMGGTEKLDPSQVQQRVAVLQTCMTSSSYTIRAAHDHLKYRLFSDTITQQLESCHKAYSL